MKVLVACEYSGVVRDAFRNKGHDAYSCDIIDCDGDQRWHIKGDVLNILNDSWDLMIAHPPCTHIAVSGCRHFDKKRADGRQQAAIEFFMQLINAPIDKICVENPVSIMSTVYQKPTQYVQPYQFGDPVSKKTCLWLKNLSQLVPTNVVQPKKTTTASGKVYDAWWLYTSGLPIKDRGRVRSKTFQGIADAMANQWG